MMFSGTHMFGQINEAAPDFDYGWFAVPDRDGKINLLGGGTAGGWALSAEAAKDPDKQAAFDAFCKYFFSSDVYGEYCEQMAAIPTTVETPKMNSSEQFQAVLDALSAADYTHLMWNQEVGNRELPRTSVTSPSRPALKSLRAPAMLLLPPPSCRRPGMSRSRALTPPPVSV